MHHPEQPYNFAKGPLFMMTRGISIAREQFDLIVFATLDATGCFPAWRNVRLDSFIYTKESLTSAQHLSPEGLLVLSFGPFREETQYRQYATVRSVFEREPFYFQHRNDHRTLVAGNVKARAIRNCRRPGPGNQRFENGAESPPTRSKPNSNNTRRRNNQPPTTGRTSTSAERKPHRIPGVLSGVILLSLALVGLRFAVRRTRRQFFFLGRRFLLMETKSVTEFALLIGSPGG